MGDAAEEDAKSVTSNTSRRSRRRDRDGKTAPSREASTESKQRCQSAAGRGFLTEAMVLEMHLTLGGDRQTDIEIDTETEKEKEREKGGGGESNSVRISSLLSCLHIIAMFLRSS